MAVRHVSQSLLKRTNFKPGDVVRTSFQLPDTTPASRLSFLRRIVSPNLGTEPEMDTEGLGGGNPGADH